MAKEIDWLKKGINIIGVCTLEKMFIYLLSPFYSAGKDVHVEAMHFGFLACIRLTLNINI